jgi:hypothetical protein
VLVGVEEFLGARGAAAGTMGVQALGMVEGETVWFFS